MRQRSAAIRCRGGAWLGACMVLLTVSVGSAAAQASDLKSDNVSVVSNLRAGNLTDIAFWGDMAVIGTGPEDLTPDNDGFVLVDISDPAAPQEISRFTCPKSGWDVSVWKNLVLVSVSVLGGADIEECSGVNPSFRAPASGESDLLVVDIANPRAPKLIAAADSGCPLSHTHTLVPDEDNRRLVVYTGAPGCEAIVEISLPHAERIEAHPQLGAWPDERPGGGPNAVTGGRRACHDVTVFVPDQIAACATSPFASLDGPRDNGDMTHLDAESGTELWDISDPVDPKLIARIQNPAIEHQHSTAFSSDGNTLVIGEEKVSTLVTDTSTCGTTSPLGALWFYDITDPKSPELKSWFQLPRTNTDGYCSAHYFSVVPMNGDADVLVSGWYSGGTNVIDFTDPAQPTEIAYFEASPDDRPNGSFVYSAYWYNGFVYATNFSANVVTIFGDPGGLSNLLVSQRGLDVLKINEDVLSSAVELPHFNPQTQIYPSEGTPRLGTR